MDVGVSTVCIEQQCILPCVDVNAIYALLYTVHKPFGITHVTVASRSERKIQKKERNDEGTAASGLLRVHAGVLLWLNAYS